MMKKTNKKTPKPLASVLTLGQSPTASDSASTICPKAQPLPGSAAPTPPQPAPSIPPIQQSLAQNQGAAERKKATQSPESQTGKATLSVFEPRAQHVCLSGEFNRWSPDATPMKRQSDGRWEATVTLPPGRYEYKFVVDGQWVPDVSAKENVLNRYGTLNSVIEVQPKG